MWHSLNRKIISTINVKIITLINFVQEDISFSFLIFLDQEIDSWFTNHKPLIQTLPYTILPLFFYNLLDPKGKMQFTFPLTTRELWTTDLHHGKHSLHPADCPEGYTTSTWLPLGQLFEALLKEQRHPPVLNTCALLILTRRSLGVSWWGWIPKPSRAPSRTERRTFWF